jgi:hypothetical protein
MPVQHRLRHARLLGNPQRRRVVVAVPGEQLLGVGQQLLLAFRPGQSATRRSHEESCEE